MGRRKATAFSSGEIAVKAENEVKVKVQSAEQNHFRAVDYCEAEEEY